MSLLYSAASAKDEFPLQYSSLSQARDRADTFAGLRASTEALLSEVADAQAALKAQVSLEASTAQATSLMLSAAGDAAGTLHLLLASLAARMEEMRLEASGEKSGRLQLERLLLTEKERVVELETALSEQGELAGDVASLQSRIRDVLVEKAAAESQVAMFSGAVSADLSAHDADEQALESSALAENAGQTLKARLQAALKDGVSLLERVQELETDKASLEEQLAKLQEDLATMVRIATARSALEPASETILIVPGQARVRADVSASKRKSLVDLLSDVENAKLDLKVELEMEQSCARDTAGVLGAAAESLGRVELSLEAFGAWGSDSIAAMSSERSARCRLEQRCWLADRRTELLQSAWIESSRTAEAALREGAGLAAQVVPPRGTSRSARFGC